MLTDVGEGKEVNAGGQPGEETQCSHSPGEGQDVPVDDNDPDRPMQVVFEADSGRVGRLHGGGLGDVEV